MSDEEIAKQLDQILAKIDEMLEILKSLNEEGGGDSASQMSIAPPEE